MNRRDLLAGLALASVEARSQTRTKENPAESLYIPKPQLVDDRRFLHAFMDEFSFVDLVTVSPSLRITHIPVWLDRSAGAYGTIHGHISRQNPQHEAFDGRQTGVIVFRGPHGYISPTWYAKSENAVPTWNFAVVHATGKLRPVEGRKQLNDLLTKLIAKFESYEGTNYDFARIDEGYKNGLMGGIIGFELEIELLEGKFKLGQDRSQADRESLLKKLSEAKAPRSLREFTSNFYDRQKSLG
uniref:Negative transcriptional regulator n=1 Tax=Solibacter usitatus (strain Ellin6076) TaxID=234267 RepID=Q01WQ5_SOLUE